jgi:ABC-type transporter Mla MlaB component
MMEMMRLENQRILAELQARSSQEAQSSKEMLIFMQKMESEKTAQAQKQQEFALQQQMQNQQMLMQQMQQIDQTKTSLLMEALKEAKSRTDDTAGMLEKLVTMKQAFSALTTEPDNREPYEKFLDKAGEMAPGLVAAISSMRGSGSQNSAVAAPAAKPRVAPNSVAVVDLPPAPAQRALPAEAARKKRPNLPKRPPAEEVQKTQMRENPSTPSTVENKKEAPVQEVAATQSETAMNEFVYPEENLDLETSIKMFVQNMEIALHRDMPVKDFYEQVAVKFPQGVLSLLKLTTSDKCVEVLEQMAPDDWMINTPAGTQYVEELHEVLTSK